MTTITRLHQLAHDMGVQLRHHDHGPLGWFSQSMRIISTRRGLAIWDYKTVLAHELGHAHYGDAATACAHPHKRQEIRANRFAAGLLINRDQLRDLARWHKNDLHALALDLEVTPTILDVYLDIHPLKDEELAA